MRASRLLLCLLCFLSLSVMATPRTGMHDRAASPGATLLVNINTADAVQLQQLRGVGPSKAAAILSWRRGHGAFHRPEDLDEVKGIGPALIDRNRDRIRVD